MLFQLSKVALQIYLRGNLEKQFLGLYRVPLEGFQGNGLEALWRLSLERAGCATSKSLHVADDLVMRLCGDL
jgi:hypothetical protein